MKIDDDTLRLERVNHAVMRGPEWRHVDWVSVGPKHPLAGLASPTSDRQYQASEQIIMTMPVELAKRAGLDLDDLFRWQPLALRFNRYMYFLSVMAGNIGQEVGSVLPVVAFDIKGAVRVDRIRGRAM